MMEHDRTRLPKWARDELTRLESQVAGLSRDLAQFNGKDGSSIQRRKGFDFLPLPDATIRFHLGVGRYIDTRIETVGGENTLSLMASRAVAVLPRAANSLNLRVTDL
jgi:hypothetical protein